MACRVIKGLRNLLPAKVLPKRVKPSKKIILFKYPLYSIITQKQYIPKILINTFCRKPDRSPLDGVCVSRSLQNSSLTQQLMDEFRLNGFCIPYNSALIKKLALEVDGWTWLAEERDEKGGPVRKSGGRLGKLDSASEDGFFYKVNVANMKKIKEMLKDLKLKKKTEKKKDDKEEK